MGITFNLFLYA